MIWRQIKELIQDEFEVAVNTSWIKNKYWIRKKAVYYPITSHQFERLLTEGYIDPDYRMEHSAGIYGTDQMIYRGR